MVCVQTVFCRALPLDLGPIYEHLLHIESFEINNCQKNGDSAMAFVLMCGMVASVSAATIVLDGMNDQKMATMKVNAMKAKAIRTHWGI